MRKSITKVGLTVVLGIFLGMAGAMAQSQVPYDVMKLNGFYKGKGGRHLLVIPEIEEKQLSGRFVIYVWQSDYPFKGYLYEGYRQNSTKLALVPVLGVNQGSFRRASTNRESIRALELQVKSGGALIQVQEFGELIEAQPDMQLTQPVQGYFGGSKYSLTVNPIQNGVLQIKDTAKDYNGVTTTHDGQARMELDGIYMIRQVGTSASLNEFLGETVEKFVIPIRDGSKAGILVGSFFQPQPSYKKLPLNNEASASILFKK